MNTYNVKLVICVDNDVPRESMAKASQIIANGVDYAFNNNEVEVFNYDSSIIMNYRKSSYGNNMTINMDFTAEVEKSDVVYWVCNTVFDSLSEDECNGSIVGITHINNDGPEILGEYRPGEINGF